jgi:hypothetical protein
MKTSTKQLKVDISNLQVDLEDAYLSFPKELTVQEKQYFEWYISNVKITIRALNQEIDSYLENGFVEEDEDGGTSTTFL